MTCSTCRRLSRSGLPPGCRAHGELLDTPLGGWRRGELPEGCRAWTSSPAQERWSHISAVDDFAACDPAQYIRVFPRLLPRPGCPVPVALRAHITRCLAVLAWRSRAEGDDGPMRILCGATRVEADEMMALGAREHGPWFAGAGPGPVRSVSPDRALDEGEAFALVVALRGEIDRGALRPLDRDEAAIFAVVTGIHPAYLWPEALLSHEFYTAAGWLGHLWRRGRADMPRDLADYFDDVLDAGGDGPPGTRDPHLARLLPGPEVLAEIHRAAQARRSGVPALAVWPDRDPWCPAAPPPVVAWRDGGPST